MRQRLQEIFRNRNSATGSDIAPPRAVPERRSAGFSRPLRHRHGKTVQTERDRQEARPFLEGRIAIIAEEGAIKQYELFKDSIDDEKIKSVLTKLSEEERVHVGELQKLLSDVLPDEQELLDKGAKEVEEIE